MTASDRQVFLFIMKLTAILTVWVVGLFVCLVAFAGLRWQLHVLLPLAPAVLTAWWLFIHTPRKETNPDPKNPRGKKVRRMRLPKRRKVSGLPPYVEPSSLTVHYGRLSAEQRDETMFDEPMSWVVLVGIFINPLIIKALLPMQTANNDKEAKAALAGVKKCLKKGLLFHLGALVAAGVTARVLNSTQTTYTVVVGYVVLYLLWGFYTSWLWQRDRLVITTSTIGTWSRQLPWKSERPISIVINDLTQMPEERTFWGKLFGYAHFDILTTEYDEQIRRRLFVRKLSTARKVFARLDELHKEQSLKLTDSGTPQTEHSDDQTRLGGTVHIHRSRNGGRPPR